MIRQGGLLEKNSNKGEGEKGSLAEKSHILPKCSETAIAAWSGKQANTGSTVGYLPDLPENEKKIAIYRDLRNYGESVTFKLITQMGAVLNGIVPFHREVARSHGPCGKAYEKMHILTGTD